MLWPGGFGSGRGSWPLTWRRPLGSSRRCPRCGGPMCVGQAWDDCPGCGYSESKRSSAAINRQRDRTAEELADPLRARVQESLEDAETEGDQLAALQGFVPFDPPRELTTERRLLQLVMIVSFVFVALAVRMDHWSDRPALEPYDGWLYGVLSYCLLSLALSEFGLNSGFLALRQLAMAYGAVVCAVAAVVLLTDEVPLVIAVTRFVFVESSGVAWIVVQLLWGLWLISLAARELRAMREG